MEKEQKLAILKTISINITRISNGEVISPTTSQNAGPNHILMNVGRPGLAPVIR